MSPLQIPNSRGAWICLIAMNAPVLLYHIRTRYFVVKNILSSKTFCPILMTLVLVAPSFIVKVWNQHCIVHQLTEELVWRQTQTGQCRTLLAQTLRLRRVSASSSTVVRQRSTKRDGSGEKSLARENTQFPGAPLACERGCERAASTGSETRVSSGQNQEAEKVL